MSRKTTEQEVDDDPAIPEDSCAISYVWSEGWRGKIDVLVVVSVVLLLQAAAGVLKAYEDAKRKGFDDD